MSDAEKALEEIAVVEEKTQNDKTKVDSAKAVEMRNRALKNLDGTQKGQRKQEVENETAPRAIRSLVDENAYKNVARDLVSCHVMSLTSHVNGLGFEYRWRKLFFLFTSA